MQDAYTILINKLSAFTQKYYQNLLIRGVILCFTFVALSFIFFAVLEHYGRFGLFGRMGLFWVFVVSSLVIFFFLVLTPIFKLVKLGKRLTDDQAARIIGRHFKGVSDKLLNVLQLRKQSSGNLALLEASINQKASELKPIPFVSAIRFSENKQLIKYLIIPLFIFAGIYASDSENALTESTERIINYTTVYIPPTPFDFIMLKKELQCIQHENYRISVQLDGDEIPTEAYVELRGLPIKMKKRGAHIFEYDFRNVQKNQKFTINAGGFYSLEYELKVLPSPSLMSFNVNMDYPTYIGRPPQTIKNTGEVLVPEGTKVRWDFFTENTEAFNVLWGGNLVVAEKASTNNFRFNRTARATKNYTLLPFNSTVSTLDSITYTFKVVKDGHAILDISEVVDSSQLKVRYFQGQAKDDYGFTKLQFVIKNQNNDWDSIVPIKLNEDVSRENIFFIFDMSDMSIAQGESFDYYFEIYDNDAVNGPKKSQSKLFVFNAPTQDDLQNLRAEKTEDLKSKLEESVALAQELQNEFEALRKKLLSKEELSWEDKERAKEVLDKQKQLEKNIDQISEKNKEKNAQLNEFSEQNKRISEKQKQLEELMDQLMTDEMRELFDEMEALLDEMKTDEWMKKLEELEMSNEDLEKELDRNLEMLKKFEFEEALNESVEKLQEVKEKQQELKESNDEKTKPQAQITEEQNALNETFEKLSKKLDGLQQKNEELEKKMGLSDTKPLQKLIEEQMKQSKESSEQNKKKKTTQSQQKSLNEMENLKQQLQQTQKTCSQSGPPEDMDALRQILENLIDLSIDEEELLTDLSETNKDDPEYVSLIHWQNKLRDDSKILEDSLYELSKRQVQIEATINREMRAISNNIEESLANMSERQSNKALAKQQLIMTSANNLALMLSHVLQSMQEDLAEKTPGEQQCDKPGSGNPSPSDIKGMQQQLKKQMEQMKKGREGQKQQSKKAGSKELAKMMGRQEMIRQQLEKLSKKIEESDEGGSNGLRDAIQKMEQTEEDIANDKITQETLNRQRQIIEHLLDAEKAEQERGEEKKREAKEATQLPHQVQERLKEYQKSKMRQSELLKTIPPKLKPFFKAKAKEYFQKIEE